MQIISLILTIFNSLEEKIIHGPREIPKWHKLYGKKYYRCGTYTRSLLLFNREKVTFIIYRFYDPVEKKTYSLLPFYISPYQRHINTTIDQVLLMYFLEKKSLFKISFELDIDIDAVRRWVKKFSARANNLNLYLEKKIIAEKPGYRPANKILSNIFDTVKSIFNRVTSLVNDKKFISQYGVLSWLNLNFGV